MVQVRCRTLLQGATANLHQSHKFRKRYINNGIRCVCGIIKYLRLETREISIPLHQCQGAAWLMKGKAWRQDMFRPKSIVFEVLTYEGHLGARKSSWELQLHRLKEHGELNRLLKFEPQWTQRGVGRSQPAPGAKKCGSKPPTKNPPPYQVQIF